MVVGDALTPDEQAQLQRAVLNAERVSGLTFSVYLGVAEEDTRRYAEGLHAALPRPADSVLVMCDPTFRALEIVTGELARRTLDDVACGLALASMKSSFLGGDLVGGLAYGIHQLGEAAQHPETLHGH